MNRAGAKHQAADALFQLPKDGTDSTPLEDELLGLVIASGEKMNDTTITIFALAALTSTSA